MFLTEGCKRLFHLECATGLKQLNHSPGLFKCGLEHKKILNFLLGKFKVTKHPKKLQHLLSCVISHVKTHTKFGPEEYRKLKIASWLKWIHWDKLWTSLFLITPSNLFLLYLTKLNTLSKSSSTNNLIISENPMILPFCWSLKIPFLLHRTWTSKSVMLGVFQN